MAYGNACPDFHLSADPSADPSADNDAGSDCNRNAKPATLGDTYGYTDANSYGHDAPHCNRNTATDSHADTAANVYGNQHSAADGHSHTYINANTSTHRDCAANSYPTAVPNINRKPYRYRAADANRSAAGERDRRTRGGCHRRTDAVRNGDSDDNSGCADARD